MNVNVHVIKIQLMFENESKFATSKFFNSLDN